MPRMMELQPKTYHYLDNKTNDVLSYGFMAQEVEELFPDFVTTKGVDSFKAITYQNFTVITIKAIQEQQAIIEAQQKQLTLNKQKNILLMGEIKKLQKTIEEIKLVKI